MWDLPESEMAIKKILGWRIGKLKMVKEIVDVMKELQEKGFLLTTPLQHKDIDLKWKDEMEIEEDNLLISYNPAEVMNNNVTIEVIQEGLNHPDFKTVFEKYKDIQFENIKELD